MTVKTHSGKPFVLVLGMHRSGTSCLAGCLERCGLFLGDVSRANQFNTRGNHELPALVSLHEKILAANGGSWQDPPPQVAVSQRQRRELTRFAEQLAAHAPCGFKDPRTLLLIDTWLELVEPATVVGTYRHPVAVGLSLATRNDMPPERAYDLWARYNNRLVELHRRFGFPLVPFELSNSGAYCDSVRALAARIGLACDKARVWNFVDQQMDHSPRVDGLVPAVCREAYDYLESHRYSPKAEPAGSPRS